MYQLLLYPYVHLMMVMHIKLTKTERLDATLLLDIVWFGYILRGPNGLQNHHCI